MVFRKKDSGPSNRHHALLIVSRYKIITLKRSSPKVNLNASIYFSFTSELITFMISTNLVEHKTSIID